jgi:hypothetical protein
MRRTSFQVPETSSLGREPYLHTWRRISDVDVLCASCITCVGCIMCVRCIMCIMRTVRIMYIVCITYVMYTMCNICVVAVCFVHHVIRAPRAHCVHRVQRVHRVRCVHRAHCVHHTRSAYRVHRARCVHRVNIVCQRVRWACTSRQQSMCVNMHTSLWNLSGQEALHLGTAGLGSSQDSRRLRGAGRQHAGSTLE